MVDEKARRDELVERLFSASVGMGEVLTVYVGDVLGPIEPWTEAAHDRPRTGERDAGDDISSAA